MIIVLGYFLIVNLMIKVKLVYKSVLVFFFENDRFLGFNIIKLVILLWLF